MIAGTVSGVLLGLLAAGLVRVEPHRDGVYTIAGAGYAIFWTVTAVARVAFTCGVYHWFGGSVEHFMIAHRIPAAALTDTLVFMAIAMLVTRTLALVVRAQAVGGARGGRVAVAA